MAPILLATIDALTRERDRWKVAFEECNAARERALVERDEARAKHAVEARFCDAELKRAEKDADERVSIRPVHPGWALVLDGAEIATFSRETLVVNAAKALVEGISLPAHAVAEKVAKAEARAISAEAERDAYKVALEQVRDCPAHHGCGVHSRTDKNCVAAARRALAAKGGK